MTQDTLPNSFDVMEELTSHFENKVKLDTFINYVTKQKNVHVIASLNESWNDETQQYNYSGAGYSFQLSIDTNQETTFIDGKHKIRFSSYSLTCDKDPVFECEDYGFNSRNHLNESKIIEISGHRFLYADISYMCNGLGCGCVLTFIYDLETKKPTFIENYRVPSDGFYISDFDNDNNPDILVISQHQGDVIQKKGLRFDEIYIKMSWFYYDKGKFKLKKNKSSKSPCSFELYSFVPDYYHIYRDGLVYSITKNNWNK